jgi:hypothetical protein
VLGFQQEHLPLVRFLRDPKVYFDARNPDYPEKVTIPATPFVDMQKPYER